MRKTILALSILAVFAVMLSTTRVNAQYTTSFIVNVDPYGLGWLMLPGVDPVYGEYIYKDVHLPTGNKVTVGDTRLTPFFDTGTGTWFQPGPVVSGDPDVNMPLKTAAAWGQMRHAENIAANTVYDFGEFIYKDVDTSAAVTPGDVRYSNVPGYKVSSVVAAEDTDVGTLLTTFKGTDPDFEKFADNLATNSAYDFARLFVDISWSTDIPDSTADGMRGYQLYCQVDPNVLTPYGWSGATGGYVLMDFLANAGSTLTTAIVGAVNPNNLDVTEQILGSLDPPTGAGDLFSGGKLITLIFIPQSQIGLSLLDLLDTSLGYQDAATQTWHTVTLADGGYNFIVPEFPTGIGIPVAMIALVPIIYTWHKRSKKKTA